MPKLPGEDGRFMFWWGPRAPGMSLAYPPDKADVKDVLDELMSQYADHTFNMFGTKEKEWMDAKHNLAILEEARRKMR